MIATRREVHMTIERNDLAPIPEDDDALRNALEEAHIPSLMAAKI